MGWVAYQGIAVTVSNRRAAFFDGQNFHWSSSAAYKRKTSFHPKVKPQNQGAYLGPNNIRQSQKLPRNAVAIEGIYKKKQLWDILLQNTRSSLISTIRRTYKAFAGAKHHSDPPSTGSRSFVQWKTVRPTLSVETVASFACITHWRRLLFPKANMDLMSNRKMTRRDPVIGTWPIPVIQRTPALCTVQHRCN